MKWFVGKCGWFYITLPEGPTLQQPALFFPGPLRREAPQRSGPGWWRSRPPSSPPLARPWRTDRTTQHKVRQQKVGKCCCYVVIWQRSSLRQENWRIHLSSFHIRWLPLDASVNSVNSYLALRLFIIRFNLYTLLDNKFNLVTSKHISITITIVLVAQPFFCAETHWRCSV